LYQRSKNVSNQTHPQFCTEASSADAQQRHMAPSTNLQRNPKAPKEHAKHQHATSANALTINKGAIVFSEHSRQQRSDNKIRQIHAMLVNLLQKRCSCQCLRYAVLRLVACRFLYA